MMPKPQSPVLIIDDDQDIRWALRTILGGIGLSVAEANAGATGLDIAAHTRPSAVILDLRMPGLNGEEVLTRFRRLHQAVPVIVITGYGTISGAVDAIRCGAFDYLTKPFNNDDVVSVVRRAIAMQGNELQNPVGSLSDSITGTMGSGPQIQKLVREMETIVGTDYTVLICGETGTGKEIVAQALHKHGPRRSRQFVVLDCGAIVDTLLESEFFGHERGAYTGASERRRGRFELAADGGTIFLDEVGNLSPLGQRALLRALEDRVIYRVGSTTPIRLDTRVIAATNENLVDTACPGAFRPDLFYRLGEFTIDVPPLRTRPEDIEFLAHRFFHQTACADAEPMPLIAPDALDLLRCYNWPGNVRQLRNVMRRAFLIAANVVKVDDIRACLPRPPTRIAVPCAPAGDTPLRDLVDQRVREVERDAILDALTRAGGNKAAAARQLGVDYKTFRKKLSAIEQPGAVQHDLASV